MIPAGPAPETVALHPVTIPGGLGGHKWRDRRLLARLRRLVPMRPVLAWPVWAPAGPDSGPMSRS